MRHPDTRQERASTFPICDSPAAFDAFFKGQKASLYDDWARATLRAVQPFVNIEQAHLLGVGLERTFQDEFRWALLHRLDVLWNLDKHRRLALMACWPDLFYWTSDSPQQHDRPPWRWHHGGRIGAALHRRPDDGQPFELQHEFNLVLTDDPAFQQDARGADVLELQEQCYEHIVKIVVFPRIFTIMSTQHGSPLPTASSP
jgi:hypothetical protein